VNHAIEVFKLLVSIEQRRNPTGFVADGVESVSSSAMHDIIEPAFELFTGRRPACFARPTQRSHQL
jgi:hypothetical protein